MHFPALDGLRMLVVVDDSDTRSLFTFVLTEEGAEVSAVASAEAALEAMEVTLFDLLITDIRLPDIDGFGLLRHVRALSDTANAQVPAIAITGFADQQTQLQLVEAEFQRVLMKPIDIEQFVAIAAELAGQSQHVTSH